MPALLCRITIYYVELLLLYYVELLLKTTSQFTFSTTSFREIFNGAVAASILSKG